MSLPKIRAKKALGQNFLIDHEALLDIANSIEIAWKNIIEVGPGYGALTDYIIASSPKSLDLVELDKDMIQILAERFHLTEWKGSLTNNDWETMTETNASDDVTAISLHHQDILTFTPPHETYSVIANIPYYITSPILFHFLYDLPHPPEEMTIMMQQEVGEKILEWRAKKPHHSFLSLALEHVCVDIEIVRYVGRESFDPPPKVDSIVLRFSVTANRDRTNEEKLLHLWKTVFTHPRKTLLSNIKWSNYDIDQIRNILVTLGYDERVRAEALKKEDWMRFL